MNQQLNNNNNNNNNHSSATTLIDKLEVPVYLLTLSIFVYEDGAQDISGATNILSAFFLAMALFRGYINFSSTTTTNKR